MNNMTVNIQVFHLFMKHWISGNVYGALAIVVENCRMGTLHMEIPEKVRKPLKLTSGYSKSTVFCLRKGSRDRCLLLGLLGHEGMPKEEAKA